MKCIKDSKSGKIERVTDGHARMMVKNLGFKYVPKHEWKAQEYEASNG